MSLDLYNASMAAAANSRLWVGRSQNDSHQRVVALIRRRDERWRCARTHTKDLTL